jgi:hypothetical protein
LSLKNQNHRIARLLGLAVVMFKSLSTDHQVKKRHLVYRFLSAAQERLLDRDLSHLSRLTQTKPWFMGIKPKDKTTIIGKFKILHDGGVSDYSTKSGK